MRFSFLFLAGFLLQSLTVSAQYKYPQDYFRNPLDVPIQLAANFGELRTNHFHMGLDIRTQSRENLSVRAAAEGYVSRIKIEKWGYGKAIYITHPNGYVTLYAHLNSFYPELENFIKNRQYEEESWEQDIDLDPGQFPVSKGQFIALSGNTGASAGPHLHFEIRDAATEHNLNPLLFGFEIPDNRAPVITKLFLYDRRFSTYEATPKQIALKAISGNYSTQAAVVKTGSRMVSFGITAEDKTSNSPFWFGIYQAELWMDDTLMHAFQLDDFSYDDTRYVNACVDYSKYMKNRIYVQHLSTLPGNRLNIFTDAGGNGVIVLYDTLPHKITINVKDANGNAARLTTMLQFDGSLEQPAYYSNAQRVLPNSVNTIKSAGLQLDFSESSFYDTVPFIVQEQTAINANAASAKINLPGYIPVHDSFMMQVKTTLPKTDSRRDRVVMFFTNGRSKDVMKGTWNGDFLSAKFKRFNTVQLLVDNTPPVIKPMGWKDGAKLTALKTIRLRCTDELDEVASFSATLENGQWLLFEKKHDDFVYRFDEYCPPGRHQLTVAVTDKAGNETTKVFSFIR